MDLWQLRIFCTVVEQKSFSRAADRIHLSQPTVSIHIKDLEDHFGIRLIDRLAKEAIPTKAGQLLYKYAQRMLALRAETETAIAEFQGSIRGKLCIGGSTIPGVYLLPGIMASFMHQYPDVKMLLTIGDTEAVITDIIQQRIEVGIVGAKTSENLIHHEPLIEDEMRLIVPRRHRKAEQKSISFAELTEEPLIIREPGSGSLASLIRNLRYGGFSIDTLKVVAEMGSSMAVIQGIKHGIGVSFLSLSAVADDIAAGRLAALEVDGLSLKRYFYLARLAHHTPSPLCAAFQQFVMEKISSITEPAKNSTGVEA